MADLKVLLGVDINPSVKQINTDLNKIKPQLRHLKLTLSLDTRLAEKEIKRLKDAAESIKSSKVAKTTTISDFKETTVSTKALSAKTSEMLKHKIAIEKVAAAEKQRAAAAINNSKIDIENSRLRIQLKREQEQAAKRTVSPAYINTLNQSHEKQSGLLGGVTNKEIKDSGGYKKATESLEKFKAVIAELEKAKGTETQAAAIKNCNDQLRLTKTLVGDVVKSQSQIGKGSLNFSKTHNELKELVFATERYIKANTNLNKDVGMSSRFSGILSEMKSLNHIAEANPASIKDFESQLNGIIGRYRDLKVEASDKGLVGQSYLTKLSDQAQKLGVYLSGAAIVMGSVRQVKHMIDNMIILDGVVTDLQIATGKTREETKNLLGTYSEMGKALGATTIDVGRSADGWLRQGFTISETNRLIKDSLMLSKLGQMESEDATKALTSSMKGYKMSVEDTTGIVDKLTAVDMEAAVSAGYVATAMAETATGARMAGVDMDRLIGYITTVGEVTQDGAESVGNFYKTLFARMGNIKAGKLVDPESAEDISKVEVTLSGLGIKLRENGSEFRNFGTVLDDVAGNWNTYGSVQKRALAVAFAGTLQQEKFLTLMDNYGEAMKYAGVATDSAGTALDKYENSYLKSVAASQEKFNAQMEQMSSTLINSDLVKGTYDAGTGVLGFLNATVEALGQIPSLVAVAFAAYSGLTGKGFMRTFENNDSNKLSDVSLINSIKLQKKMAEENAKSLAHDVAMMKQYETQIDSTKDKAGLFNDTLGKASIQAQNQAKHLADGTITSAAYAAQQKSATSAVTALTVAQKAATLGMQALSIAGNMAIGLGIGIVINFLTLGISKLVNAQQNAIDKANEMQEAYRTASKDIASNMDTLNSLGDEFTKLSGGVDDYGRNISLSVEEHSRYKDIVSQILEISPELISGYDNEGKAIANKNGLIEDSIKLLEEENRLKLESITSDENLWTIAKGKKTEYGKSRNEFYVNNSPYDKIRETFQYSFLGEKGKLALAGSGKSTNIGLQNMSSVVSSNMDDIIANMENIIALSKEEGGEFYNLLKPEQIENLRTWVSEYNKELASLEQKSMGLNPTLQLVPQSITAYQELTDAQRSFVSDYINGFRITSETTEEKVQEMKQEILDLTQFITDNSEIQDDINNLLSLDKSSLSAAVYDKQVKEIIAKIAETIGKTPEELKIQLGVTADIKQIDDIKSVIREKISDNNLSESLIENLSIDQLKYVINNFAKLKITAGDSLDSVKSKMDELQESVVSVEGISNFSDILKSTAENMDILNAAEDEMRINGTVSVSTLQNLADSSLEYKEYLDSSTGSILLNTSALKEKINTDLADKIATSQSAIEANNKTIAENKSSQAILENRLAIAKRTNAAQKDIKAIEEEIDELESYNNELTENNKALKGNIDGLSLTGVAVNSLTERYKNLASELEDVIEKTRTAQDELAIDGELSSESVMFIIEKYPELIGLIGDKAALQEALHNKEVQMGREKADNFVKMIDEQRGSAQSFQGEYLQDTQKLNKDIQEENKKNYENFEQYQNKMTSKTKLTLGELFRNWRTFFSLFSGNVAENWGNFFSSMFQANNSDSNASIDNGFRRPVEGTMKSPFGYRKDPITGKDGAFHNGMDFAAPKGTPIYAAASGKVIKATDSDGGFGNEVQIQHADGTVTQYAHASKLNVDFGQMVKQGDVIAYVGSTGRSTGNHLHFGVQEKGKYVNPEDYLSGKKQIVIQAETVTTNTPTSGNSRIDAAVANSSQKYGLDPALVMAVIKAESSFNPNVVSGKNAQGLMQLIPQTAKELGVKYPFNIEQNIEGGARYLRQMLDSFNGDEELALAAYNAGIGRVKEYGGVPPFPETQNYLKKVSSYKQEFGGSAINSPSSSNNSNADITKILYDYVDKDQKKADEERKEKAIKEKIKEIKEAATAELEIVDNLERRKEITAEEATKRRQKINEEYYIKDKDLKSEYLKLDNQIFDEQNKNKQNYYSNLLAQKEHYLATMQLQEGSETDPEYYEKAIQTHKEMLDIIHEQAEWYRSLNYIETSDEIMDLQKQWQEHYKEIGELKYQFSYLDYNETKKSLESFIAAFDFDMDMLAPNDFDKRMELLNKKLKYQEQLVENDQKQILKLSQALHSGEIDADKFKSGIEELTKSFQDNTIAAKESADALRQQRVEMNEQHLSAMSDIIDLTKEMIQQELEELNEADEVRIKALKDQEDLLKKQLEKEKDIADEKKDALKDEHDLYKDIISDKKRSLDLSKEDRKYTQQHDEKTKAVTKIQDRLAEIQNNDSLAAKAERKKLNEELAEKKLDLDNLVFDNNIDRQKEALDSELERHNRVKDRELKLIERNLKVYEDTIKRQIELNEEEDKQIREQKDEREKSIQKSGELARQAMKMIDEEGDALYGKLIAWNNTYGTGIENDIGNAWKKAKNVMEGSNDTLVTMRGLMSEIAMLSEQIAGNMASYDSNPIGVRSYFESVYGADVGWNDKTNQFSINGNWFDSNGYSNVDGRLKTTIDGIKELEEKLDKLGLLPKYDIGGVIKTDHAAVIHQGERILRPIETTDLHSLLPQMVNMQSRIMDSVGVKNKGVQVKANEAPQIVLHNTLKVDGIATDSIVDKLESKFTAFGRDIVSKVNKAANSLGGSPAIKAY